MSRSRISSWLVLAALGLAPAGAAAQSGDSAVAQSLFDQAKQFMSSGRAAEACPKFEESQRLEPRSGTLINLAKCYEETGRLASAWSKYRDAATAAKADGNAQREVGARQHASALAPRLSKLTIVTAPALKSITGLRLTRDGVLVREPEWDVALPVDPGEHDVSAEAPGYGPFHRKVNVTGDAATATISVPGLVPEEAAPAGARPIVSVPPAQASKGEGLWATRTAALVAGGVGVVGVGFGTAFGLMSKSKHDQAARACPNPSCTDPSGVTAGNDAVRDGTRSTVAMIVGAVGLAAGVTLWLASPNRAEESTKVGLGLGTLQLRGAF